MPKFLGDFHNVEIVNVLFNYLFETYRLNIMEIHNFDSPFMTSLFIKVNQNYIYASLCTLSVFNSFKYIEQKYEYKNF